MSQNGLFQLLLFGILKLTLDTIFSRIFILIFHIFFLKKIISDLDVDRNSDFEVGNQFVPLPDVLSRSKEQECFEIVLKKVSNKIKTFLGVGVRLYWLYYMRQNVNLNSNTVVPKIHEMSLFGLSYV